jgi:hypothetical protein
VATSWSELVPVTNPELAVAGYKAGLQDTDLKQIRTWDKLYAKHRELLDIKDDKVAFDTYNKLDPTIQQMLTDNFQANYMARPQDWTAGNIIADALKLAQSPFKAGFKALETYSRAISLPYLAIKGKMQGDDTSNLWKIWRDDWDGTKIFDKGATATLDEAYGKGIGVLAKGIVSGMTPGEIIENHGGVDPELEFALTFMSENPTQFQDILSDYKRTQASVGRDIARGLFGAPTAGMQTNAEKSFDKVSGIFDATYQIMADPLTYATLGFGPALKAGAKLAKIYDEMGGGSLGVKTVFENKKFGKQVVRYWNTFGPYLDDLANATSDSQKAKIRDEIALKFPEYNNEQIINELVEGQVKDADSAKSFFSITEHAGKLVNGRTDSMQFYRSNQVATANRLSVVSRTARSMVDSIFNTADDVAKTDIALSQITEGYIRTGEDVTQAAQVLKTVRETNPAFVEAEKALSTIKGKISKFASRHPLDKPIYVTDEMVRESSQTFNELSRIVLPKNLASALTQKFIGSNQAERIALLRGLMTDVLTASGLGATPKGVDIINTILDQKFIGSISNRIEVATDFVPTGTNLGRVIEENGRKFLIKEGPTQPNGYSNTIGNLDWREISELVSKTITNQDPKYILRNISPIVNGKFATEFTNAWSVLTLFPKLGVRATVDELFFFVNYAPKEALYNFFSLKGLAGAKIRGAATAKTVDGKRVASGISLSAEKIQKIPDLITEKETIDIFNKFFEDVSLTKNEQMFAARREIAELAVERFTGISTATLSADQKKDFITFLTYNPQFGDAIASGVAGNMLGIRGKINSSVTMSASKLTEAFNTEGYTQVADYIRQAENLSTNQKQFLHYYFFHTKGARNSFKDAFDLNIDDPIEYAMRNNGLKTTQDVDNAVDEIMSAMGLVYSGPSRTLQFIPGSASDPMILNRSLLKDGKLKPQQAKKQKALEKYLYADVESAYSGGTSPFSVLRDRLETMMLDLRQTIHGTADFTSINDNLVAELNQRAMEKGGSFSRAIAGMTFDDFKRLSGKNTMDVEGIYAPVDFVGDTVESLWTRVGNKMFEFMDQQVTSIYRTPAFFSIYLANMDRFRRNGHYSGYLNEVVNNYKKLGYEEKTATRFATDVVDRFFTEEAAKDSANLIMKYADNPQIRSQLAFSLRNGARFYRATEDFMRRVYRMKDVSLRTVMRMRLSALGLDASGVVHEDAQGQKYVLMPMDDLMFQVIDKPIRVLTGGKSGYSQPLFGDFTIRLAQINPSFGPDAAMPTLSGPIAGANVVLFKAIAGRFGESGRVLSDKIDNLLLGDIGDNITLRKAILPVSLDRILKIANADEKDKQELTAIHQAIAYDAAHGRGLAPNATPEEQYEYIKNVRIGAHNVVIMRNLLGLTPVPFSPTLKESKDVPKFLQEVGITSIRQEFFDIYENVLNAPNPRIDDPFEEALAIYIGKNPGKLVYTVSRAEKDRDIAFRKTDEVKDWYIKNTDLIEKYGEVAFLAAPSVGDFSASSYAWFEAAGMIKNKDLQTYLNDVRTAEDKQLYFDLEERAGEALNKTFDPTARKQITESLKNYRDILKVQNPLLRAQLESGEYGTAKEEAMLNSLQFLVADPNVKMDVKTRDKLTKAVEILSATSAKLQYAGYEETFGVKFKREVRDLAIRDLEVLGKYDSSVAQANKAIFIPILKNYSRDTRLK